MCAVVTVCAELMAYPIDTVRRRMMMTSGEAVKYSGAIDATVQIVRKEGTMALMRGAGYYITPYKAFLQFAAFPLLLCTLISANICKAQIPYILAYKT